MQAPVMSRTPQDNQPVRIAWGTVAGDRDVALCARLMPRVYLLEIRVARA